MQGTRVRALIQEDPTCCRATKPARHNYWACTLEPASHDYWAHTPRLPKPAHRDEEWPPLATTGESHSTKTKTQHSNQSVNKEILKKKKIIFFPAFNTNHWSLEASAVLCSSQLKVRDQEDFRGKDVGFWVSSFDYYADPICSWFNALTGQDSECQALSHSNTQALL